MKGRNLYQNKQPVHLVNNSSEIQSESDSSDGYMYQNKLDKEQVQVLDTIAQSPEARMRSSITSSSGYVNKPEILSRPSQSSYSNSQLHKFSRVQRQQQIQNNKCHLIPALNKVVQMNEEQSFKQEQSLDHIDISLIQEKFSSQMNNSNSKNMVNDQQQQQQQQQAQLHLGEWISQSQFNQPQPISDKKTPVLHYTPNDDNKQHQKSLKIQDQNFEIAKNNIDNEEIDLQLDEIKLQTNQLQQQQQQQQQFKQQDSVISNFDDIAINLDFNSPYYEDQICKNGATSPQSRLTIHRGGNCTEQYQTIRSTKNQTTYKSINFESSKAQSFTTAGSCLSIVEQKKKRNIFSKNNNPLQPSAFDKNYLKRLNDIKRANEDVKKQIDRQSCELDSISVQDIEQDYQSVDDQIIKNEQMQVNVENLRFGVSSGIGLKARSYTNPVINNGPKLMPKGGYPLIQNHFPLKEQQQQEQQQQQQSGLSCFHQRRATVAVQNAQNKGFKVIGQVNNYRVVQPQQFKQGFLQKKAHTGLVGYQKRWVVVTQRKLKYYKKQTKGGKKGQYSRLRGVIDFDLLSCKLLVEEGSQPRRFSIDILANKRSFKFKAASYQQLSTWVRAINSQIQRSRGDNNDLTKVAIQKQFWRYNRCTQRQFIKGATTGDILLFQGKSFTSKFQRVLTRSQYDHVALLLKYKTGKLSLFEATGQCGVEVLQWGEFMRNKWHLLYPKLVWRKLHNFERRPQILKSLQQFVKNSKGKKYKISTRKLMKKKNANDFGEEVEENRSFFCSELVASAFKLMGLLPKQKSCTQYWPGSFAAKNNLKLLGNSQFSEEILIDFTL